MVIRQSIGTLSLYDIVIGGENIDNAVSLPESLIKIENGARASITGFSIIRNINIIGTEKNGGALNVNLSPSSSFVIRDTTFSSI